MSPSRRTLLFFALALVAPVPLVGQGDPPRYAFPGATGVDLVVWSQRPIRVTPSLIPEPIRELAPAFALSQWSPDGTALSPFDSRSLTGQVVLLDFWAPTCAACIPLHDRLVAEAAQWRDAGVEIVSVLSWDDTATLSTFLERHGGHPPFPILLDRGGEVTNRYSITGLPAMRLLDHHGRVAWQLRRGIAELRALPRLFPTLALARSWNPDTGPSSD